MLDGRVVGEERLRLAPVDAARAKAT